MRELNAQFPSTCYLSDKSRMHYTYLRNSLEEYARNYPCQIEFDNAPFDEPFLRDLTTRPCVIPALINGVLCVFDVGNFPWLDKFWSSSPYAAKVKAYFKFDYTAATASLADNIYPFPKVSFTDWSDLETIIDDPKFTSDIQCRMNLWEGQSDHQFISANRRRRHLQYLASSEYKHVKTSLLPWRVGNSRPFLEALNTSYCCIHEPGAYRGIVDATVLQAFAAGCPVISPPLHSHMVEGPPIAGYHYISLPEDYTRYDIREAILDVGKLRSKIIDNASRYFWNNCAPGAAWTFVVEAVEDYR